MTTNKESKDKTAGRDGSKGKKKKAAANANKSNNAKVDDASLKQPLLDNLKNDWIKVSTKES